MYLFMGSRISAIVQAPHGAWTLHSVAQSPYSIRGFSVIRKERKHPNHRRIAACAAHKPARIAAEAAHG